MESSSHKVLHFDFEFWLELTMVVFGMLLVAGHFFVFGIMIPQNLAGIWSSMDSHLGIFFVQTTQGALVLGAILTVTGMALLVYPRVRTARAHLPHKPAVVRPLSLKFWAVFQTLAALAVIYSATATWYDVMILGGPWGTSHSHYIPLYYPLLVLFFEIPAIALAFLTYWRPRREYFLGWITMGSLRLLLAVILLTIPWFILLPSTILDLPNYSSSTEFFLSGATIICGFILAPTLLHLSSLQRTPPINV